MKLKDLSKPATFCSPFENDVNAMTGNGNDMDLLKKCLEKFVKPLRLIYFGRVLAILNHCEGLSRDYTEKTRSSDRLGD